MKKIRYIIIGFLFLVILVICYYIWTENIFGIHDDSYYEISNNNLFEISTGNNFSIRLRENPSTGKSICWINESKCHYVKLIDEKYKSSWREKQGYDGAGGTVEFIIKGTAKGIDTIKFSICPTIKTQKNCSFFCEDSLKYHSKDSINYDIDEPFIFIVKVADKN